MTVFVDVYKRQAGMGFSNVDLGIAHSMAHTLGAVYDTPHGVACAMMLPDVYKRQVVGILRDFLPMQRCQ